MKQEYKLSAVRYGFSVKHRKWIFTSERGYTFFCAAGGKAVADKIAEILNKGFIRTNGKRIDGATRVQLLHLGV